MKIADLHIHSKYARGTSKFLDLDALAAGARAKGVDILGTGDFTHPLWLKELKAKLQEERSGVYTHAGTAFILSTELSLIYKDQGKTRKVHHLILAPDFDAVDQINAWLDTKGRRDYDGRPIFGFSSIELVDAMRSVSKDIEIIPAHVWTPWFSVFGSKSGYDSLAECFQDTAKHIHAIETGLSSDPLMNWRISSLDGITLVSNSDCHSAGRIGREANAFAFDGDFSFRDIIAAIMTRKRFLFTVDVDPNFGKYHFDGHRNCGVCLHPHETKKTGKKCPNCRKELTIGVLHRVEELADRPEGFRPHDAVDFKRLLPLSELIAAAVGQGVGTKKVGELHGKLIREFGNEFAVLLQAEQKDLEKAVDANIADIILRNRDGTIRIEPGYDGVYGTVAL